MELPFRYVGAISGLEQAAFLNVIALGVGPLLLVYGFVRWRLTKKPKADEPSVTTVGILLAGLVLTILGWVYYRYLS